jgi:hypothetical protein
MTDRTTGSQMRISTDGRAGPYLIVPVQQVDAARRILDQAHIHYWVDRTAVSMSGGPLLSVINFGKNANADDIQAVLDRASNC